MSAFLAFGGMSSIAVSRLLRQRRKSYEPGAPAPGFGGAIRLRAESAAHRRKAHPLVLLIGVDDFSEEMVVGEGFEPSEA